MMGIAVGVRLVAAVVVVASLVVAVWGGVVPAAAQPAGPVVFVPPEPLREAPGVSAAEVVVPAGSGGMPSRVEEVVGERTERSKTWLMSDGSMQVQIVAAPLHVPDSSGGWVDIDAS